MHCTIIILNWNGKDLLAQGLPSVVAAVAVSRHHVDVLVVDNGSTDDSIEFIKKEFPSVNVSALKKNQGFGEGNNIGVQQAGNDIVVLLNNDMIVENNFLEPLLKPFETQENVFAVGCQIFLQDATQRRVETGKTYAYWDNGTIRYLHQDVTELDAQREYVPVFWASGGAVAYDRKKFLELGGFRSMYSPAYVEDTDLSYRAWKRGWCVLFATRSIVYHKHRASSSKRFDPSALEVLVRRNQLLFIWSNISSLKMLVEHFLSLPWRLIKYSFSDPQKIDLRAFTRALPKIVDALQANVREHNHTRRRDRDLLIDYKWVSEYLDNKSKLSILFVCPYVPCVGVHAGGARMYQIIRGLSTRHEISVLTFIERESEQAHVDELKKICKQVVAIQRVPNYDEPDWFHVKPQRFVHEFAHPEMKRVLEEEVRSGKYDLLQFEYLEMGYLAHQIKQFHVPMILTNHEVQSRNILQSIRGGAMPFFEKIEVLYHWMLVMNFELNVLKLFDTVITLTDTERASLVGYEPSLPVKVHNTGVDVKYFSDINSSVTEEHSMVFVGYYRHYPNADAMLYFCSTIFPLIKSSVPDAKMYIVGAEPTQALNKLHDGESVFVTGRVDDIRPYMAKASVYIVPMRLGAGIRGKIMEAWSMKKAVVSTPIAASGLQIEPGENIIIAESPDEFAKQVIDLFTNKEMRKKLGENGYRTATDVYDWPAQVRKHEEIYYELLNKKA